MPVLHPGDVRDLEHLFGPAQSVFGASPFGELLKRQQERHEMSDGTVVDTRRLIEVTRELAGSTPENPRFATITTAWGYMQVSQGPTEYHATEEELDARDDERHRHWMVIARVGRRLLAYTEETRRVLELLYGDEGCRWNNQPLGRIWALAYRTPIAQRVLARDLTKRAKKGLSVRCHPVDTKDKKAVPVPLHPSEVLALLATEQTSRPAWVDAALDEATKQQNRAVREWCGLPPEPTTTDEK